MTYGYLPQVARHIANTHCYFAGNFATINNVLEVLGKLNAEIMRDGSAVVGAVFSAKTNKDCGLVRTEIDICKRSDGGWEVIERSK